MQFAMPTRTVGEISRDGCFAEQLQLCGDRDRRKRTAMNRRGPELLDDAHMARRTVALVVGEAVAGIESIKFVHQAVARDLGDNRCGRDAEALSITADDFGLRQLEAGNL